MFPTLKRVPTRRSLIVSIVIATAILSALPLLAAGKHGPTFLPRMNYSTGYGPESIAIADFNLDGKLDVATVNVDSTVSVFLGNGDGTFQPYRSSSSALDGYAIAVGDFNSDGKPDIATASIAGQVSILLGNGDGSFQPPISTNAGSPWRICVGDFNQDGKLDLAVGDSEVGTMYVLLGNGDGTLQTPVSYSTGGRPQGMVTADLNGDGKPDLAIAQSFYLGVFLGNGDGTFQTQAVYYAYTSVYGVTVGDFNSDGILDAAIVGFSNHVAFSVDIFIGNGDGTFGQPKFYKGGPPAADVVAANFIDNTLLTKRPLDLVVLSPGTKQVTLLEGRGNGYFLATEQDSTGGFPNRVAAGDFNGDGATDVVVPNATDNTFSILLNTRGSFMTASSSLNPSVVGEPVTFTTTVTTSIARGKVPTGSVTFRDGPTVLGSSALVNGQASFTTSSLSTGQHTIHSHYSGDVSFNQNDAPSITQQVNP
jgi:hypothetical protein